MLAGTSYYDGCVVREVSTNVRLELPTCLYIHPRARPKYAYA